MIIWEGNSQLDGTPIVAIMTGFKKSSKNSKTGKMPQIWIIRADIHPVEAMRNGQDSSICGACPHRPKVLGEKALSKKSRSCYVNAMPIGNVYRTYARGGYNKVSLEEMSNNLAGRHVRLGAYGDPAAVPIEVWEQLLKNCESTGYTHQWKDCDKSYAKYCMASCDTPLDVVKATRMGYRTFFVQNVKQVANTLKQVDDIKFAWCPEIGRAHV